MIPVIEKTGSNLKKVLLLAVQKDVWYGNANNQKNISCSEWPLQNTEQPFITINFFKTGKKLCLPFS